MIYPLPGTGCGERGRGLPLGISDAVALRAAKTKD